MDLFSLTDHYQAPPTAYELVAKTRPLTFSGPTGSGKNTLVNEVRKTGEYEPIVSHTTREPRENNGRYERNKIDYIFIKNPFLESLLIAHKMVEAHPVHGNAFYGTSIAEHERVANLGKRAIMDVDIKGADDYNALSPSVRSIFLIAPSIATQKQRLAVRAGSPEEAEISWQKRKRRSILEIESALDRGYFYFLINHDLGRTAFEAGIIASVAERHDYDDSDARREADRQLHDLQHP